MNAKTSIKCPNCNIEPYLYLCKQCQLDFDLAEAASISILQARSPKLLVKKKNWFMPPPIGEMGERDEVRRSGLKADIGQSVAKREKGEREKLAPTMREGGYDGELVSEETELEGKDGYELVELEEGQGDREQVGKGQGRRSDTPCIKVIIWLKLRQRKYW
jgi:hypothetical protein